MEQRRTQDHHTMINDRPPQNQLQIADHARPVEHGEGNHAQSAGHGGVGRGRLPELSASACLKLIPGCETPGFDWASPNAVKVWHALYDHARRLGLAEKPRETDIGTDHPEPYLYCIWAVDLMARLLAVSRNTVGSASVNWLISVGSGKALSEIREAYSAVSSTSLSRRPRSLPRLHVIATPRRWTRNTRRPTKRRNACGRCCRTTIRPTTRMNLCPIRSEVDDG